MSSTTVDPVFRQGVTPEGWQRAVYFEEVWGTVVVLEVRDEVITGDIESAFQSVTKFLHQVDDWFSTYRIDTPISALRMGFAELVQMPTVVQEVLAQCEQVKELTGGAFDPWAVKGGVDPSGYVKGWAADVAADMLVAQGYMNVSVNAAGDISCRGYQSPEQPWVIGIRHPDDDQAVVGSVAVLNAAIATSGEYERGKHIINPWTKTREMALKSATVIGPDGGLADALATALLVSGTSGIQWFTQLPDWSGVLIEGDMMHTFGPLFPTDGGQ
jgi:thiamine biosynthesis lipoprotein